MSHIFARTLDTIKDFKNFFVGFVVKFNYKDGLREKILKKKFTNFHLCLLYFFVISVSCL